MDTWLTLRIASTLKLLHLYSSLLPLNLIYSMKPVEMLGMTIMWSKWCVA
jgi:hypothetical protein